MASRSRSTHHPKLVALLGVVVLVVAPVALADRGGNGGKGNSASSLATATVSPGGPYSFGEQIYVTTNVSTDLNPYTSLACYQGSLLVATGVHAAADTTPFGLGPTQSWGMGAADCTVTVYHQSGNRTVTDATASFHVDG